MGGLRDAVCNLNSTLRLTPSLSLALSWPRRDLLPLLPLLCTSPVSTYVNIIRESRGLMSRAGRNCSRFARVRLNTRPARLHRESPPSEHNASPPLSPSRGRARDNCTDYWRPAKPSATRHDFSRGVAGTVLTAHRCSMFAPRSSSRKLKARKQ